MQQEQQEQQEPIQQSSPNPNLDHNPVLLDIQPAKKNSTKKLLIGVVVILVFAAVVYGLYLYVKKAQSSTSNNTVSKTVATANKHFCYVRLSHLVCVDNNGANSVRYDLPKIKNESITGLFPSPDQTQYVAKVTGASTIDTYWLLDSSLKNPKQVVNTEGDTISKPTWSHDGKSLFMELNPAGVPNDSARQIYRYDIAGAKFTKLTNSRYNSSPFQLADGRILFSSFSGTVSSEGNAWVPFIMSADGSNQQPYASNLAYKNLMSVSYDSRSDVVYLMFSSESGDPAAGKIVYFPSSTPNQSKFVNATVGSSADTTVAFSTDKILFTTFLMGTLVDTNSGKPTNTIKLYGVTSGELDITGFTKSAIQVEDPHERIFNLASSPMDFQSYITKHFDSSSKCDSPDGEISIMIKNVVHDEYAVTLEGGCDGGSVVYYAKVNGTWANISSTQMGLGCDVMDKYKVPKEIADTCINSKGNQVTNTNL